MPRGFKFDPTDMMVSRNNGKTISVELDFNQNSESLKVNLEFTAGPVLVG